MARPATSLDAETLRIAEAGRKIDAIKYWRHGMREARGALPSLLESKTYVEELMAAGGRS